MKKTSILFALLLSGSIVKAQTKSTGVKPLGSRMTIKIDKDSIKNKATFTVTGPSDRWFAVAYRFTTSLFDQDCIIANTDKTVSDALFPGGAGAIVDPIQNIKVISNTVSGSTRTIVVERALPVSDPEDVQIDYEQIYLPIAWAIAPSATFDITKKHLNSTDLDRSNSFLYFVNTTGIKSLEENLESLSIYPNPASNILHINAKNLLNISTVKIFNSSAQLIKEVVLNATKQQHDVDISGLAAGTYFLEISNNSDKLVKKIQIK